MSLPSDQRLISADDHMDIHVLPPDLWQSRLPKNLRDRAPKVVETDDGPWWESEGRRVSPSGRKQAGYLNADAHGFRPGQPETRMEDMDRDGVYSQVIYSPLTTQLRIADGALRAASLSAYNDWAAEFNAADRNRLVCLAHVPAHDPKIAADELLRVAKLGHRGAIIGQDEGTEPIFMDSWKPFWDAAQEVKIPIHGHLGPGLKSFSGQLGSWSFPAMVAIIPMQLDETLVGMIFSGMLEQRPDVKFVLGEAGLGWVPYVLERMDQQHENYYEKVKDHRLEMKPSEIFRRQVFLTYEDEGIGVRLIPEIGVDNVMWASDYPHGDSTWPHSRKALTQSPLAALGNDVLKKVTHDTAARIYGIG
jgi:predicted TIM-barrel fold metal-dependent hydrolase